MRAEAVTPSCVHHGEGPVWDDAAGVIRWVDMLAGDVMTLTDDGTVHRRHLSDVVAALRPRESGGFVVGVERGFLLVEPDGSVGPVHPAFSDPGVRMNDGACDPRGRFLCGSMAYDSAPGRGALYRFDTDRSVTEVLSGLTVSNGLAWSADRTRAYYVDSGTGRIDVFDDPDADGGLTDRRPVVDLGDVGTPDGLAVDVEDGLWVAVYGSGAVHRYTPDGRLDAVVEVPASNVTSCAFGGPGRDVLYITTSRQGLAEDEEPGAGALFRIDAGVRGAPVAAFAG